MNPEFEELTEGEELERKEELKTKWAQLEAVVGADNRVRQIAEDILGHFDARLEQLDGKAMVVCMSRRICVELYRELVRLRPQWEDADDTKGEIKVVMTGSASDPVDWQKHIRSKSGRETLANRFRDPDDPFRGRAGQGHVAHRVRRTQSPHDVRGQAHAGPWAISGHHPGEPGIQGQARRAGGGLPGAGE